MQTVSTTFENIVAQKHKINLKVEVEGTAIVWTKADIQSFNVYGGLYRGNVFGVGGTCSRMLKMDVVIGNASVPKMAQLNVYIQVETLTTPSTVSEWIPKGVFFIDTRQVKPGSNGITSIVAYDSLLMTEQEYTPSSTSMTDSAIVSDIASLLSISLDARNSLTGDTLTVPSGYTMREILSSIATNNCGNWVISEEGALRLVPMDQSSPYIMSGTDIMYWKVGTPFGTINRVNMTDDRDNDYTYSVGTGDAELDTSSIWASNSVAEDILVGRNNVFDGVASFTYTPLQATCKLHPATEVGDTITYQGINYQLATINWSFNNLYLVDIELPGDEVINHEFPYVSPTQRKTDRKIQRKAESVYGDHNSFAWELVPTAFNLYSNGELVMTVTSAGATFSGTLSADDGVFEGTLNVSNPNLMSYVAKLYANQLQGNSAIFSSVFGDYLQAEYGIQFSTGMSIMPTMVSSPTYTNCTITTTGSSVDYDNTKHMISYNAVANLLHSGSPYNANRNIPVTVSFSVNVTYDDGTQQTITMTENVDMTILSGSSTASATVQKRNMLAIVSIDSFTATVSPNTVTLASGSATNYAFEFNTHIVPNTNGTLNLGASGKSWDTVYAVGGVDIGSDRKLKSDISHDMSKYIEFYKNLKPAHYKLKSKPTERRIGLIAQEVDDAREKAGLLPNELGLLTRGETMSLKYGDFIALNIEMIQSLIARVETLENQVGGAIDTPRKE